MKSNAVIALFAKSTPFMQAELHRELEARMDALWLGRSEKLKALEKKDRLDRINREIGELTEKLEYAKKCLEYEKAHG
jgi:transcription elongation GreA/GreB family factor